MPIPNASKEKYGGSVSGNEKQSQKKFSNMIRCFSGQLQTNEKVFIGGNISFGAHFRPEDVKLSGTGRFVGFSFYCFMTKLSFKEHGQASGRMLQKFWKIIIDTIQEIIVETIL